MNDRPTEVQRVKVDGGGRIVIPAMWRDQLGIHHGDEVILFVEDDTLHVSTFQRELKRAQAYFRQFATPGVSIVDELLRERREEAARE